MFGIPAIDLTWLALTLLFAGAVTGMLAGLFGVGGGAVIVPTLYELLRLVGVPDDVRMPMCVGTSLAIIIPTSIRSYREHRAKGIVDTAILRQWAVPVVVGVILGTIVARYAPAELFKAVFVLVATVSAVRLLVGRQSWALGSDMPRGALMTLYGWMIGMLSALMGIGGGQLSNLLMAFYNRPIHQAIATSSGLGVLISIPGAIGYVYAGWGKAAQYPTVAALQLPLAIGYVSLLGFVLFVPTSMMTAPLGARLAHSMSKRQLEVAFGLFLLFAAGRFAWSLFG
jgi:uncharacterized membrane protein YfcA